MEFIFFFVLFAAGYAASIFTWDMVRTFVVGVETQVRSLEDKIKALKAKL